MSPSFLKKEVEKVLWNRYNKYKVKGEIKMKIILASTSPRRKDMMDLAKINYEVMPSDFDEIVDSNLNKEEQSKEIAYGKAKDIFEQTQGDRTIIGADTLVILGEKQFGKAKTKEEAIQMLKELQGKTHFIYTSLAILIENHGKYKEYKELHKVKIFVKEMTDEEIENYVDSEKPFYCAGAYAIQGFFTVFIDKIEGDYPTALGFPIHRVYSILKENKIL